MCLWHAADGIVGNIEKSFAEYVSEKDITADSQGGNFINIVSGGGYQDVKIWNSIPDNQKQSMYDNYVKWIKKRDFNNRKRKGFDYYYHKLMGGK